MIMSSRSTEHRKLNFRPSFHRPSKGLVGLHRSLFPEESPNIMLISSYIIKFVEAPGMVSYIYNPANPEVEIRRTTV
jgi:hypothetical protein